MRLSSETSETHKCAGEAHSSAYVSWRERATRENLPQTKPGGRQGDGVCVHDRVRREHDAGRVGGKERITPHGAEEGTDRGHCALVAVPCDGVKSKRGVSPFGRPPSQPSPGRSLVVTPSLAGRRSTPKLTS